MTDSSGAVVWSADYKPFGEATITVSTVTNNLRFPGQYYDAETGLNYNYFRDYNPVIGRYVEPEPIGQRGHIALYPYANQNPLGIYDPNGREAISATAGTLIIGGGTTTAVATVGAVIVVGAGAYVLTTEAIQGTWLGNGGLGNLIYDLTHPTNPRTLVPSTVDQPTPNLSGSPEACRLMLEICTEGCNNICQSGASRAWCKTKCWTAYLGCMLGNL